MHLVGHFLAHLTVGVDFTGLRQRKLQVLILQFIISHNRTVSPDLEITFLQLLELRKGVNHTDCFLFLGHNLT